MVGALVAAPIADRIGRKFSISFWSVIHMVGIIVQIATDTKWYQVAVGRLVAGLGVGALSSIVPMYQSESAPRQVRGAMVSAFQLFVAFGIFISYIVNYGTHTINSTASWRITMGIGFAWPLILGVGTLFLPESPRYAYSNGRFEEARQVMCKLYGVPSNHRCIAQEMQDMKDKFEEENKAGKATWHEIFTGPRMLHRTILGIVLQSLQQLTGANFIFYFGNSIFSTIGLDSYITQIILGAVNFGMTFPGLYIVEHMGRRNSLILGGVWMFICFMVWASVGHLQLGVTDSAGNVMIAFTCLFIVGMFSFHLLVHPSTTTTIRSQTNKNVQGMPLPGDLRYGRFAVNCIPPVIVRFVLVLRLLPTGLGISLFPSLLHSFRAPLIMLMGMSLLGAVLRVSLLSIYSSTRPREEPLKRLILCTCCV